MRAALIALGVLLAVSAGSSGAATGTALPPSISSFSPASGPPGTTVTIAGKNLQTVDAGWIGDVDLQDVTPLNATHLKATLAEESTSGKLRLASQAVVGAASAGTFKVTPRIDELSPRFVLRGATFEIHGVRFTGVTSVRIKGVAAKFTFVDDGTIEATVPAGASRGTVTVTTPSGTGSSRENLVVILPPTITTFYRTSGVSGDALKLSGTNLDSVDYASLNAYEIPDVELVSATQLTVHLYWWNHLSTGRFRVANPAGTSAPSAKIFTIRRDVAGMSPDEGRTGDSFDIDGTALAGVTSVKLGGKAIPFTVENQWTIHATAGATEGSVTVSGGGPTGTACCWSFAHDPPPPSVAPRFQSGAQPGPAAPIGQVVWLSNMAGTGVKVNGVPVEHLVDDGYRMGIVVPPGATTGHVRFWNAAGDGPESAGLLRVAPAVLGVSPQSGPPGTVVTITGTSFTGAVRVQLGKARASFTLDDDSTIHAVVPSGATSGPVQVTTCTGPGAAYASYGKGADFTVTEARSTAAAGDPEPPPSAVCGPPGPAAALGY